MPARGAVASVGPDDTHAIGARIGAAAQPAAVIALIGPLGAGKTHLTKGIAAGLGVGTTVNSPTFVLMNEHAGRLPLFHIDAYRLDDGEEAHDAGLLDDRQAAGVTVVEWADRLDGWLPPERLEITISTPDDAPLSRVLEWVAIGQAHEALARSALEPA